MALPARSGKGHGSNAGRKTAPQPTKRASHSAAKKTPRDAAPKKFR